MPGRRSRLLALGIALAASGVAPAPARAAAPADRAIAWLVSQQRANGAFGSATAPADATAEVVATLRAGGVTGAPIERALELLRADGPARAREQAAYAARIVFGLHAAGADPRSFGGTDFVAILEGFEDPVTGRHGGNLFSEALVGLGRVAVGSPVSDRTIAMIRASRCRDGGFGYDIGCTRKPDVDTTSLVVSLFLRLGVATSDDTVAGAVAWLRDQQDARGAFPFSAGQAANANSTGLAASAIALLGDAWNGRSATAALEEFIDRDSGGFRYLRDGSSPNLYATVQAIPGVLAVGYPLRGAAPRSAAVSSPSAPSVVTSPRAASRGPSRSVTPVASPTPAGSSVDAEDDREAELVAEPTPAGEPRRGSTGPVAFALALVAAVGSLVYRISRGRFSA